MSDDKEIKSSADNTDDALLDTAGSEYVIRYNLFYTGEEVAGVFLPTGHANLTMIERDGTNDTVIGGGNIGVNLGGQDSNGLRTTHDRDSNVNPFDSNLDGIVGIDPAWQASGQAIYEQSVTPEQLQKVQDHIEDLTGGLDTALTNYNVGASVLPLTDQHSCYSFTQDVFEIAGGKGRVIDQFSEAELNKIKDFDGNPAEILIETVHGDIPKIPERAVEKFKDTAKDAADAMSNGVESAIENAREKTGIGSSDETEIAPETIPTAEHIEKASLSTQNEVSLHDAVETLSQDYAAIENAYEGGPKSPIHEALSHPSAPAMFQNLHNHGVETLNADISPELNAEDRASNILLAGESATHEAGLEMPEEQQVAETSLPQQNLTHEPAYEEDYSYAQ